MTPFIRHEGLVAAMDRVNVDTDQIIPKQFLKRIERSGFGRFLFHDWRFDDQGEEIPDFELNQPRFHGATILLARTNFGCGSSREHAPWALGDFGFRAVLAPSFADIFYNNCFKNGLLPLTLSEDEIDRLFRKVEGREGYRMTVDLEEQTVADHEERWSFEIDPFRRQCLLEGLDDIGLSLRHADKIEAFEKRLES